MPKEPSKQDNFKNEVWDMNEQAVFVLVEGDKVIDPEGSIFRTHNPTMKPGNHLQERISIKFPTELDANKRLTLLCCAMLIDSLFYETEPFTA